MAIEEERGRGETHLLHPKELDSTQELESLMLTRISMDRLREAVVTI
jgi:hypothetical protein